jgi:predicted regulator of amino acid metabolism with ACT domain
MSNQDKTLKETIADAVGGNKDTASVPAAETKEGISGDEATGETKSGETPEYVSGIDISDIPEQERPRIKELLSKKAKLLEDGYQGKFKEVAEFKKAQEELVKAGLSVAEAKDVLLKHIEQKRNPLAAAEKKDIRTLDKLITEAPVEQRSALEQFRTIAQEEGIAAFLDKVGYKDMDSFVKDFKSLKDFAMATSGKLMEDRKIQIEKDLEALSSKFGKDLVEKYREVIAEKALQHPNVSINKIFQYEVPIEEIEQAILLKGKKPLTEDKRKAITSSASGITSATEKIDTKKSSYADLLMKGLGK